jgi:hypothetical protein
VKEPNKTILVVENEPTVLARAASISEDDLGYAALLAASPRKAIALLELLLDHPIAKDWCRLSSAEAR